MGVRRPRTCAILRRVTAFPFHLVRQISSGPDGLRYLGVDEHDVTVTVDRLFLAQREPRRWTELSQQLKLVANLEHEHALPLRAWRVDDDDPYVVTERLERTLNDALADGDVARQHALTYVSALGGALAQAHNLGLAHGRLSASSVVLGEGLRPLISLSGARTESDDEGTKLDHACRAGERGAPPQAADVFALGVICVRLASNSTPHVPDDVSEPVSFAFDADPRLETLLVEMLQRDAHARPSIHEVLTRLARIETTQIATSAPQTRASHEPTLAIDPFDREQIGRYKLGDMLGEGGMGRVYRAENVAGGPPVALKVLLPHLALHSDALNRFYREARVLSELDNPHIARFIEVSEDTGLHYLAMEFVDGQSLEELLAIRDRLSPEEALVILRDIALALADVHDLGVVHRDVKPANVLMAGEGAGVRAKLCDFGIARSVNKTKAKAGDDDDGVTVAGVAVGTPKYMAPEQCVGSEVDARADVYAAGITLFRMLTGATPFGGANPREIVHKHLAEPVPDIRALCPGIDERAAQLLEKALEKHPDDRFANARELLEALELVRRGGPSRAGLHPSPDAEPSKVQKYDFSWRLQSSPAELWAHVSNTERLNRAIGLNAVEFSRRMKDGNVETYGKLKLGGLLLDWREHAYEWIAPNRLGVLREFSAGPFVWMRSEVQLKARDGGGTDLNHRIEVLPRGMLGRAATAIEVGYKAKKNLERVYKRIDRFASDRREGRPVDDGPDSLRAPMSTRFGNADTASVIDPFEPMPSVGDVQLQRIDAGLQRLLELGVDSDVATRLCDYLRWAPPQAVSRIRPREFAVRFVLDHREVLRACLHGAHVGLLELLWDVICPHCQVPSSIEESMRSLRDHSHCEACDVSFELDFGRSIEVIFRAHPEVRDSEIGVYCIGGPGHTPHVLAQLRLAPQERFSLELHLEEGSYRVAGRQLPMDWGFSVRDGAPLTAWELSLRHGLPHTTPRTVGSGRQRLVIANDYDREVVVRVERGSGREHAVTAAEVACNALFRQLFPAEVLAPGHLISVSKVSLMLVELADAWKNEADEANVFTLLTALKRRVDDIAAAEGGAIIKIYGDGVMVSFPDSVAAARAASALYEDDLSSSARVALHSGAAMATSINDRLDYFGRMVRQAGALLDAAGGAQLILSEAMYADTGVAAALSSVEGTPSFVDVDGVVAQLWQKQSGG
jgi:serine/threonine protein kinase